MGSLQCLLVSLSGLSEGLILQVFPPSRPRPGLPLMGQKGGSHSSPSCILLWHDNVAPPMQAAPQRGQDVPDCLLSPLGPTRWWTGQLSQQIYTMVEFSDLFMGGLVPYKFYGRYVCLWVWFWQALLVASSNEPLCLLLSFLSSMQEHIVEDDGPMRPFYLPSGYSSKNNLALSHCSDSLIDSPTSLAHFLVDWDLCSLSP